MVEEHAALLIAAAVVLVAVLGIGAKELITWMMSRERDRGNEPPDD